MTVITKKDLDNRIDSKVAWLNTRSNITVDGLDKLLSQNILKTDSVFNSNDKELIALKNCGRLAYHINFIYDKEYPNSVFSVSFKINIEDSVNPKADLTNCLVKKGSIGYNIYDLDDEKHLEKWNKDKENSLWFENEVEEYLEKNPNPTQDEVIEILEGYAYNKIDD